MTLKRNAVFEDLKIEKNVLKKKALQWSLSRGSRSGREALNFVKSLFLN